MLRASWSCIQLQLETELPTSMHRDIVCLQCSRVATLAT